MTIHYHMGREDVLALNQEFYRSSPSTRSTRFKVRVTLPAIMLAFWCFTTVTSGLNATTTGIYAAIAVLWYVLYPARFDRNVMKATERMLDEASFAKMLGPCELTLSEDGLRSKSALGESSYPWSSVERVCRTDAYVFIFLAGNQGYPIAISQVGADQAAAAYEVASRHVAA